MTATTSLTLTLTNSDSPQNPTEFNGWKVVSFGLDKITDEDRDDYVAERNEKFSAKPANIGLAAKLKAGTAFWLSYYEHGDGNFSLAGEGTQDQWDTTALAGILLWELKAGKLPKGKDERAKLAREFIDLYNNWANGNVYSWRLTDEDEDIDGGDECYDDKAMFDSIREAVGDRPVMLDGEAKWLAKFHGEGLNLVDEYGEPVDLKRL